MFETIVFIYNIENVFLKSRMIKKVFFPPYEFINYPRLFQSKHDVAQNASFFNGDARTYKSVS